MRTRSTDPSDLDRSAALQRSLDRDHHREPRVHRRLDPDLSRQHAFQCRAHAILSGEQPEPTIDEAREEAERRELERLDGSLTEEQRQGWESIQ